MTDRWLLAALAMSFVAPCSLAAQDSTHIRQLDTIGVTAERRPATSTATPSVVRVITASQLRARAADDLVTVLRDVPGLQVDQVVGSGTGISMQGLGSDRIQILIDGAPVEGRLDNQFDLTRLDPSQFERIEVVEGPQSTLYGSTALGGVINLITRRPSGRQVEVDSRGGSYGQFGLSGRVSELLGNGGISVGIGHRHIGIAPGSVPDAPGSADRWDLNAGLVQQLGGAVLDVRASHTREGQQYPQSFGPGFDFANDAENRQTDALAILRSASEANELRAHASVYEHTLSETDQSSGAVSVDPQSQRLADLEFLHRGAIGSSQWVAGARVEHEWITTARLSAPDESSNSGAVYGSADWQLSHRIALSTGARVTVAQRWGGDVAPRLGLVWTGHGGWYGKVGLAHGFRAPSFTEQFSDFVNAEAFYAVKGNVDLKPETSWNLTGEVGARMQALQFYVRAFGNRLRNFIEPDVTGQDGQITDFTYVNVGRARTVGGEVGGDLTRGIATFAASYAYLDARDEVSDQPLLGRAKHTVRAAVTLTHRAASLTGEFVRTSAVPITSDQQSSAVVFEGAAPRVNVRAGWDLQRMWRINLGVDNVGDVVPVNAVAGYGRRWFAGASWVH